MKEFDWTDLRGELPETVRARLDARRDKRRLGRALAEVRKASSITQQRLAGEAGMTQNSVSKMENAEDVLVSSLVRYMQALGGSVEIVLRSSSGEARTVELGAGQAAE